MVRVWRWLYSSHNTLHLRSCKRSALQLLLAASSVQQDKATVILHSPLPPPIVSTLITLFSSYSLCSPPFVLLFFPHLTFFSTYFILHIIELTIRSSHVVVFGDVKDCIPVYIFVLLFWLIDWKRKDKRCIYNIFNIFREMLKRYIKDM